MDTKQKGGFTKTGFSKAGFAACGRWQSCELGKLNCFYEKIDPEVMEHCFCYQRHHSSVEQLLSEPIDVKVESEENVKEEKEQLSLF